MIKSPILTLSTVLATLALSACGKTAGVQLKFVEGSSAGAGAKVASKAAARESDVQAANWGTMKASTFKMKFMAAYLAEDIDPVTQNNIGRSQMIWVSPECQGDLNACNINPGVSKEGDQWTKIVTAFFDFTNTQTAQATLNSQQNRVDTGKYKYVRLEFCKAHPDQPNGDGTPNIQWASDEAGVTEIQQFRMGQCSVNSTVFDPPLDVQAGSSVTISLNYTLDDAINSMGYNGPYCKDGMCFQLPDFQPSATVDAGAP